MACRFCFEFTQKDGNKVGRFKSHNGMEYTVNLANNMRSRQVEIRITSNAKFDAVVTLELYEWNAQSFQAYLARQNTVLGCETTFTFNPSGYYSSGYSSSNYNSSMCVISVIPLLKMQDSQSNSSSSQPNILKPVTKGIVIEKKLDQLSADMKTILLKDDLADVILSDGSTDFSAHKIVLSVRSPVFKKMFQHSMKEKSENRVTITDITADVLKELLSYIYTGTVCIKGGAMARNLYVAADKYDIQHLKNVCSVYLKDVNLGSVLDTLILANLYEDKTLKQSAMDFIANNFSQVKAQESWGKFIKENQVLTIEVLSFVVEKK